eukprot:1177699-Prorocentrum_minimum.AAC.2
MSADTHKAEFDPIFDLSPECFGVYSGDAEFDVTGFGKDETKSIRVIQSVRPDSNRESVFLWNAGLRLARLVHRWGLEDSLREGGRRQADAPTSASSDDELPCASLRCLELGAGLGVAGIALAMLGADVVTTDMQPALQALSHMVHINGSPHENIKVGRVYFLFILYRVPWIASRRGGGGKSHKNNSPLEHHTSP